MTDLTSDLPRTPVEGGARRAIGRVHRLLARHGGVSLPLELPDGSRAGPPDAEYRIHLHHPGSLRAMLWPPSDVTAGQAYVNGAYDISGDIVATIADGARLGELSRASLPVKAQVAAAILRMPSPPPGAQAPTRAVRLSGRLHSRERDRAAVSFHYDHPATFYSSFLDTELTYSCAYFATPRGDLDLAQRRKHDLVCRKLRLQPGDRLLDVGSGFGSLLLHAARHYGVTGVGVTLSQTQVAVARERIAAAGLSDRIEVRLADYRDLHERFDAVASIGMIEHVGPEQLDTWWATVRRLVGPGGLVLCHGIVLGDAEAIREGTEETFVTAYVFPDGGLVPAWRLVRHAEQASMELLDVHQLRPHYEWTLRTWIERLEANREQAVAAAGEDTYRIWRTYLAGSAYSFATRSLGVVQVLARAPGAGRQLPPDRAWMEPTEVAGAASPQRWVEA